MTQAVETPLVELFAEAIAAGTPSAGGVGGRPPTQTPDARSASDDRPAGGVGGRPPTQTLWTSGVAWQVTAVMATQATTYFMLVTWLPSIEIARGVDPVVAGWETFVYQIVGLVAGIVVAVFMRGRTDHRLVGVVISLLLIIGVIGMLVAPGLSVLWIVLAGLSGGSSLVIALALVGERTRTTADAARLSGMAQSVGYLLAVIGPLGAGLLFEASGSWTPPLLGVIAVTLIQIVACLLAGRDRFVGDWRG